jgi:thiamine pyrophosphokinase
MRALIIANGSSPPRKIVRVLQSHADLVVCADGGANRARAYGIKPHVIIGDFDSISRSTRTFFSRVPVLAVSDQESTDLEKAIEFCIQRRVKFIDVVGATGARVDHAAGNLGCFKKFGSRVRLRFVDSFGLLTQVRRSLRISADIGDKLSLIPLDRCVGVTTENLKYPLQNDLLELGVREGTSNEATGTTVRISLKRGTLLLYRFLKKKYFSQALI